MDFSVLGPVEVRRNGALLHVGSRMQRRLLALLLVHAGEPVDVERVVDVLWEGDPPPSAHKGVHTYASRLRAALGGDASLDSGPHGYRLVVDHDALDARRFEQLVATARSHLDTDPARAGAAFDDALALWRGPAYGEFAHEEFARPEAVRLEELRLAATEDAFAARLAGDDGQLIGDLVAFIDAHPLREGPHAQLMTALARAGRQSEALEVYARLRRRLADDLGLEPSPALAQLELDILRQAPDVMPTGAIPSTKQRPTVTGPVGAGGARPTERGNLPEPVTSFVGRGRDTAAVCELLGRFRLVTLTGPGGVGKTRLALHVAAGIVEQHRDGVWWCDLAPTDAGAVDHTIAEVLGVQPQANRSITEAVVDALAGRELVLVLDNCEHVVDAIAGLVDRVLRSCPDATLLATSREPLAVTGEQVWQVRPLPLPTDGAGGDAAAVLLFADRANEHRAGFRVDEVTVDTVAEICRQLDGLPLAIELAAALVPALEPDEIAHRLGQRFGLLTHGPRTVPRHRSLAAVVEWSYGLLDVDERHLFDRLAVFSGGFTLAAAEGVCADTDLPAGRVAGLLAGLVTRSMVEVDRGATPTRYRLLETLRHYADEQLAERGEVSELRARHAAWFVQLAERADAEVRGRDEAGAATLLVAELANLRAAHRWAVAHTDADTALRLAASLWLFATWRLRDEVFDWAEEAAGLPTAAGHRLRPTVWGATAIGLSNRGELTRSRELAQRALADAAESGVATPFPALAALWSVALYEGRLAEHAAHSREALDIARRAGNAYEAVWAQVHGVLSLVYGGDRDAGRERAQTGLAVAEELGNPGQRAWARYVLAEAYGDDDPDRALALLGDALTLAGPVGDRFLEGVARVTSTSLLARHRAPREALAAFPDVIGHWQRAGDWTHQWTTLRNLVPLLVRLDADEAAARLHGAQRSAHTETYGDDAVRLANASETLCARLGAARFETLAAEGATYDGPGAVAFALDAIAALVDLDEPAPARARPGPSPRIDRSDHESG